uniref:Si:dkey-48p11.3 n=1 Tax=Neogobius melanostomus TaxID=47308 RepID=A0A8C6S422_9GOBI
MSSTATVWCKASYVYDNAHVPQSLQFRCFYFEGQHNLGNKTKLEKMRSVQTGVQIIKRESDVFVFSAGASADFLPQMAEANEKLKRQMEAASPEQFHIENVEEAAQVIEMTDDSDSDSDSDDDEGEVTENNIRLPGDKKRKAQIQVLQEEEK